jgi:hypothetical protein
MTSVFFHNVRIFLSVALQNEEGPCAAGTTKLPRRLKPVAPFRKTYGGRKTLLRVFIRRARKLI